MSYASETNILKAIKNKLSALTNSITALTNWVNAEDYSTSEVKTGKKWIDGRPIYRKVDTGTMTGTSKTVYLSPTNVNEYLRIELIHTGKVGFAYNVGWGSYWQASDDYANYYLIGPIVSDNQPVCIRGGNSWPKRPYDYSIVIEYTKTTDSGGGVVHRILSFLRGGERRG